MCVYFYVYIYIYIYIYINCSLWIITTISESDINDNTLLKIKTMKFEFEECNIITDIILEYWSMEMLIQTEPGFTYFYSWKKTPGAQCPHPPPQHCLLWMWAAPPSICGWPLLHSKGLSLKGPKQECLCDFQESPLLSFLSSLLPSLFCPVLSYYTTDKICFPIRVITKYWQHSPFVNYILEHRLHLSLWLTLHHLCISPSPPPIGW